MRYISLLFILFPTLTFAQNVHFPSEILDNPIQNKDKFDKLTAKIEVPVFRKNELANTILLETDYVSSTIKNPKSWPNSTDYKVSQINLVFSKYPADIETWKTNYYVLMANRYKELFKIDSRFNNSTIKYYVVLQTNCQSENEARKLFHGFEIMYTKSTKPNLIQRDSKLAAYMNKTGGIKNTELYDVLSGLSVDSTLLVMDCTGSMTSFKNQLLMYIDQFKGEKGVCVSLFNDDRSKGNTIGYSGGVKAKIFYSSTQLMNQYDSLDLTLPNNPDIPENDVEAIVTGIKTFPFVKRVILFRDQESCVRDIDMIKCVQIPVYVFADEISKYPNSHTFQIAAITGGAAYIGNGIWLKASDIKSGGIFQVGYYQYEYSSTNNLVERYPQKALYYQPCENHYKNKVECDSNK